MTTIASEFKTSLIRSFYHNDKLNRESMKIDKQITKVEIIGNKTAECF